MKILPLLLPICLFAGSAAVAQQFQVQYTAGAFAGPFTGRVLLFLNKDDRNPKGAMIDIQSFPCFAVDVKNVKPGVAVVFDDKAVGYPVPLSDIERGEYYVQAVWDRNLGGRAMSESPGNMYSAPQRVNVGKETHKVFRLQCSEVVPGQEFHETELVKEMKVPSALLSRFCGKPVTVHAAVLLPKEYYKEPGRKFPLLVNVSGYGGDYHRYSGSTTAFGTILDTIPTITLYLDGNCPGGHSVYANSDNNGPWGDALVKELLPAVEREFRCDGPPLLWGHSSGGWTVLWLQTHYPTVFGGCWSSSPDPVDFRSFQQVDLYAGDNMFYAKDSNERMVATIAGSFPVATQKQAYGEERVIYRGEQMHSFNYVFSAKGADGRPVEICDPVTGVIDPACVEHWKKYDISLYLRSNWPSLEKDLKGKVRVTVGTRDNFLLNYAVHMLDDEMKKLGTPFVFAYFPGDHFTVSTPEWWSAGMKFLEARYLATRQ
ncbi:MAG TPA: alpha/beta hydrolase-fold protein [Puia sp.]|nr:alpha/beta hydrolase-fold protein [Puia sp.]